MKIQDDYEILAVSDDPVNVLQKADTYISVKELYNYIAKSKKFRKILIHYLIEDGVIPMQGD